jgi:nicotinate-nucleotide adenylyltransferase
MKIGLLGGSFNPPHLGHIHISLEAKKRLNLNKIWWVPAKQNPFKEVFSCRSLVVSRLKLCEEITKNYPQILVKDLENNNRHCKEQLVATRQSRKVNIVYTIDLLKKIIKQYPKHQFYWIMGADNILQFHKWKDWQEIVKLVPLIVCDREDFFYHAVKSKAFLYAKKIGKIEFLRIKKSPESSTRIRNIPKR